MQALRCKDKHTRTKTCVKCSTHTRIGGAKGSFTVLQAPHVQGNRHAGCPDSLQHVVQAEGPNSAAVWTPGGCRRHTPCVRSELAHTGSPLLSRKGHQLLRLPGCQATHSLFGVRSAAPRSLASIPALLPPCEQRILRGASAAGAPCAAAVALGASGACAGRGRLAKPCP